MTTKQILELRSETIELYKVLKTEGLCSSGGEAKLVIEKGMVTVNGQPELRKRKKLANGDQVEYAGNMVLIQDKSS